MNDDTKIAVRPVTLSTKRKSKPQTPHKQKKLQIRVHKILKPKSVQID